MMAWNKFPSPENAYVYTPESLKKSWARLHIGDVEPLPDDTAIFPAWIAFHAGEFENAAKLGWESGSDGFSVGCKATCIYANYLEPDAKNKLALFEDIIARCEARQEAHPEQAAAWYWHAYALGRYAQGISVVKALAEGVAKKVRISLDMTLKLAPNHADAHIAMGSFQTEIIDAVGPMIGRISYNVKKDDSIKFFKGALNLNPGSAIARIEYANALMKLDAETKMKEALRLYVEAIGCEAVDAMERLDVDLANSELEDDV
jgi:tetratricopeptide (TPR) repeat protein